MSKFYVSGKCDIVYTVVYFDEQGDWNGVDFYNSIELLDFLDRFDSQEEFTVHQECFLKFERSY